MNSDMEKLFGTDGIRARAGDFPLDENDKGHWSVSRTTFRLETRPQGAFFVTGRDTRESGKWIEQAIHTGASSVAEIESASVITTPGVAYITGDFGFDAGIVSVRLTTRLTITE